MNTSIFKMKSLAAFVTILLCLTGATLRADFTISTSGSFPNDFGFRQTWNGWAKSNFQTGYSTATFGTGIWLLGVPPFPIVIQPDGTNIPPALLPENNDMTHYSGTLYFVIVYEHSSGNGDNDYYFPVSTITYLDGVAIAVPPIKNPAVTGRPVFPEIKKTNEPRIPTKGDPVQLATGLETSHRTLFSFNGARNWSFEVRHNSALNTAQSNLPFAGPIGYGWTHNFESKVTSSGSNRIVQLDAIRANTFTPVSGQTGVYSCSEDAARYDTLTAQSGGGWLLVHKDQSARLYNSAGRLLEDRDPQGRKLVITYTGSKISSITEPVSNTSLSFAYDGNGRVILMTDGAGKTVSLGYPAPSYGLLSSITNQRNYTTTFTYDDLGQLLTLVDHTGATVTTNAYDKSGRVLTQDDGVAGNQPLGFTYSEQGVPGTVAYAASDTQQLVPIFLSNKNSIKFTTLTNINGQDVTYTYDSSDHVISAMVNGQTTTVTYNSSGVAVSLTDPAGQVSPIVPTVVATVTDRNGKQEVHTFDATFNELSAKDALNQVTNYAYDSANRITAVTDPLSRASSYTYDSQGNVLTSTDPAGKVTTFAYDARNNLLTSTDAASQVTTRTYDSNNNLLTAVDALGRTTAWTYDANSLPLTMTVPGGGIYHYTYTNGRLTTATDPNGVATNFGYDADGRLLYREDALGKRVTFTYDAVGNVLTVTLPPPASGLLPLVTTYAYDHRNRVTSVTEPTGAITSYTYDNNSNLLTSTDALGKITAYGYDGEDRLKTVKDALNRTTTYNYDDAGRLTSVVDPANNTTAYEYDAAGQLTAVVDALGKRTTTEYNSRGLLTKVTDPLTRAANFAYDDVGRRTSSTDPLNRQTGFEYDALNRLQQVTDPGSLVAKQGFDLDGNRTSLTNPANNATAFAYDAGGRLTGATTPEEHTTGYSYNSRGLPASVTEPSGQVTTFAYDDSQRLSSTADTVDTIILTRDSVGRVLTVVEGSKTLTRVYDLLGRLTSYTDGGGNTIGYQYDDIGRLTKLTYPDSKQVAYAYDTAGRLSTVTDWASRVTTYSYDAIGRMTQLLRSNGTKQTRAYNDAGELTQLRELAPDGTIVIYSGDHSYDAAGQLTGEALNPGITPASVNVTQTFDRDNRLLTHNGAATTFDADGNLLTVASGLTPSAFSYDARNRLTSAGGLSYGYNAENRRISVTDSSGTANFVVNPNATLDQVLVKTASNGAKTFYVYGLGLLHEEASSVARYYHFDRRGDTIALSDASGAVTGRTSYGVYGEILSRSGVTDTAFLFNGRWGVQTDSSGIYYQRARYFCPELRRFLNSDPIGISGGANFFAYAGGNPISNIDPLGLYASPYHFFATLLSEMTQGHILQAPFVAFEAVWADFRGGSQGTDPAQTSGHAMAGRACEDGPYQTSAEAKQTTKAYVKRDLDLYEQSRGPWWKPWAGASYLGNAYHAVQDSYAEGHGYQPWDGGSPLPLYFNGTTVTVPHVPDWEHIKADWFPSPSNLAEMSNASDVVRYGMGLKK